MSNPNRKRVLAVAAGLVGVVGVGSFLLLRGQRFTIELTQAQIQEKLDAVFPLEKRHLVVLTLTLSDPHVELKEGEDRIRFALKAEVNLGVLGESKPLGGSGAISTGIRYDPQTYSFHLDDPVLEKLEVQGVPVKYVDIVTKLAGELAEERIRRLPVYTLPDDDLKQKAARLVLKGLTVRNGKLVITLGL